MLAFLALAYGTRKLDGRRSCPDSQSGQRLQESGRREWLAQQPWRWELADPGSVPEREGRKVHPAAQSTSKTLKWRKARQVVSLFFHPFYPSAPLSPPKAEEGKGEGNYLVGDSSESLIIL